MSQFPTNDAKFAKVKALNLPLGHYAITARGLREISDIDMIVDDEVWAELAKHHPVHTKDGFARMTIDEDIEVLGNGSFFIESSHGPTLAEQIAGADVIDGLPFVSLHHVLYFKEHSGRDKDKPDIERIKAILSGQDSPS